MLLGVSAVCSQAGLATSLRGALLMLAMCSSVTYNLPPVTQAPELWQTAVNSIG
jgi:hypothetical protein